MRQLTRSSIVLALAVTALAVPAGAQAATNPYTAVQICGPTYTLAKSYPLYSNNRQVQMGIIQMTYSLTTGKSCGVVLKVRQIGRATYTSVTMGKYRRDQRKIKFRLDGGPFKYYAGPVYTPTVPACVRIGGYMAVPGGREGLYVEPGYQTDCRNVP